LFNVSFMRACIIALVAGLALAPVARCDDWVVTEYDGRTDWLRYDFVGWVRVEQPAKPASLARGTAAVTLRVLGKLSGDDPAEVLTLEYAARVPIKEGDEPPLAGKHYWNEDVPEHREYFVFLNRLGNGAYWCDDQREFAVRDGRIQNLPEAYTSLVGGEATPPAGDLIARARMSLPAFRVRIGRPNFAPPLMEKGKPVETPQQGYERVRAALVAGDTRELDRLIHTPGGSPKEMRAVLLQEKEKLAAWPVRWQAVLDDKGVVILAPPGERGTALYLIRRGARWHLLNTSPDTEAGRQQVSLLMTESQFAFLTPLLEREFRSTPAAPR
jgi:hypothetical protein